MVNYGFQKIDDNGKFRLERVKYDNIMCFSLQLYKLCRISDYNHASRLVLR